MTLAVSQRRSADAAGNSGRMRRWFRGYFNRCRCECVGRRRDLQIAASRDVVLDEEVGADWCQLPLEGDLQEIVAAFRELPHGQLGVLGDAGAGKSILAMPLDLGIDQGSRAGPACSCIAAGLIMESRH